ncbi:MAG: DUF2059 domain-containing protein [Cognaticolwellia sp.]
MLNSIKFVIYFVISIVSCSSLSVFATSKEEKSIDHLVESVLEASDYNEFSDAYNQIYLKQISDYLELNKSQITPDQYKQAKVDINNILKKTFSSFFDNTPEVKAFLKDTYRQSFSEKELGELLKFYESPAGKKLLAIYPLISRFSVSIEQQIVDGIKNGLEPISSSVDGKEK